jgi:HK97 family phage prohead protease
MTRPTDGKNKPGELEYKLVSRPYQMKAAGGEGSIEGYGAVFNDPHPTSSWWLDDDWQDVIAPGAFTETLADHAARGTKPVMLYMHQRGNVPGAWSSFAQDMNGLKVSGQISPNAKTPSGAGVYELAKMGAISGLSIGFNVLRCELDEETKVRTLTGLDLNELSIVDVPAGPSARITDVKVSKNPRFLEQLLRDAGVSRREAKVMLSALRDAEADDEDDDQRDADHELDPKIAKSFREGAEALVAQFKAA